ncbi:MAG: C39 family peptidase [Anaerolineales bacterium]|nr:C39 family peptidase [Anaerolineales bacterium]
MLKSRTLAGKQMAQNIMMGALGVITAIIIILLIGYAGEQLVGDSSSQVHASDNVMQSPADVRNPDIELPNLQKSLETTKPADQKPASNEDSQGNLVVLPTNVLNNESNKDIIPDVQTISTPTPIPRTPDSFIIEGVQSTQQERTLNCEFTSASDLASYYGYSFTWQSIFLAVGFDPNGNPHVGFVGKSVDDAPRQLYPNGYGVYAEPIARGLNSLGLDAQAFHNKGIEWLKQEIKSERPVIIWAPFDMEAVEPTGWYTADSKTWVKAIRGEHTFTIIGYNDDGVYVNDPWYGHERFFTWPVFERAWNYLDQMAVSVQPDTQ